MPHGREDSEWNELIQVGYDILSSMARSKAGPISYTGFAGALADGMGGDHRRFIFPEDRNAIGSLLAEISVRGLGDRPGWLLSAMVAGKNSQLPGEGFYDLAKSRGMLSLGAGREEKEVFFGRQLEGLWLAYGRRQA